MILIQMKLVDHPMEPFSEDFLESWAGASLTNVILQYNKGCLRATGYLQGLRYK